VKGEDAAKSRWSTTSPTASLFVVSQALSKAVQIEGTVAQNPRIVIGRKTLLAIQEIIRSQKNPFSQVWCRMLIQCEDGNWCVNPFWHATADGTEWKLAHAIEGKLEEYSRADAKVFEKYLFVADMFNYWQCCPHRSFGPIFHPEDYIDWEEYFFEPKAHLARLMRLYDRQSITERPIVPTFKYSDSKPFRFYHIRYSTIRHVPAVARTCSPFTEPFPADQNMIEQWKK